MCGIAGLVRWEGLDPAPLDAMLDRLGHRGPDDRRTRVVRRDGRPVLAMGVRRLAIVDPEGGAQPREDHRGRWLVALNGEIYNHRSLAAELRARGVPLRGRGDTEVLVELVADIGLDVALPRLRGMFAMALAEPARRRLWLVRDRMGVKPLYWARLPDGAIAWASEPRALLPLLPARRARTEALRALLLFEYVPSPWTPWEGVFRLEPGTWLEVGPEGARVRRWWTPPVPAPPGRGSMRAWAQSVAGCLQVAVLQRLEADTDIAFLVSGGLDSSAVAAIGTRALGRAVPTFSVSVDAPGFDEGPAARRLAAAIGSEHREIRFGPEDLELVVDEVLAHVDEPLADASLLPTWQLMREVRAAGFRCALSGDGADEAFGGYPTYLAHLYAEAADRAGLAGAAGRAAALAGRAMPTTWTGVTPDYMVRRFAAGAGLPWQRRHQVWMGAWLPAEVGATEETWAVVDAHARAAGKAGPVGRAMYLDQRLYLADGVLAKVDRASMAHGLEVRSPFLDHHLVELAAQVPESLHVRPPWGLKRVLRRAVGDLLPPEIARRRKQGFGAPLGAWLRGPARPLLEGLPEAVEGLLDPEAVRRAIREHMEGREDHRRRLWSAIVLARWRAGPHGVP